MSILCLSCAEWSKSEYTLAVSFFVRQNIIVLGTASGVESLLSAQERPAKSLFKICMQPNFITYNRVN